MDYKETLNLPKTSFSMRANLPQNEPLQVDKWERGQIYLKMVQANEGAKKYILHDGPPYANGNIHLGHALNKILKDIIVKYKNMTGFSAPYIPGWDCHGLPIELQVEKDIGRAKKLALSKSEIRALCKDYAEKYIGVQKSEFKRLGVLGDWQNPYRTIDHSYEAAEIRELGKIIAKGLLYRQKKPVYWCASCVTALAEAEVEYEEHSSPSIYVKFKVKDPAGRFVPAPQGTYAVIWTTTPWTLPANLAIAVNPSFMYRLVKTPRGELILKQEMIPALMKIFGVAEGDYEITPGAYAGQELEGVVCSHPWLERDVKVLPADFVTADQGTGAVHIAPGHGQEDYELGQRYGLDVLAPVDTEGKFTTEAGDLAGNFVFKADPEIIAKLRANGSLLAEEKLFHSYPHCWRCKKPVIFRATEQWFVSMEREQLRARALAAIDRVQWIPPWGRDRIRGMLESRPDWCISRQRSWGVPIPVLYCKSCNQAVLSADLCNHIGEIFEAEGSDAWFNRSLPELLPPAFSCPSCGNGREFVKEEDILDVWFDSGISHAAVVETRPQLGGVSDLYLEGSDQHRGWFHTALLTSVATRGRPPYNSVLTHGFTLDGKGRKMSKSLGNVVAPQEITKKYGAELLRLWTAAEDYHEDVRISDEIVNRLVEAYRKLRNTSRFLIGNLYDFDPLRDAIPCENLDELDRWILHRTQILLARCHEAYQNCEFHIVYHSLNNFCSVDLSAQYLDIVKDRLYCEKASSDARKSAQTTLYKILEAIVHLMAPILSFTAEEIWEHMSHGSNVCESVFLSRMPVSDQTLESKPLGEKWEQLFQERGEVLKALEAARNLDIVGHSLDAKVVFYPAAPNPSFALLDFIRKDPQRAADFLIVSQVALGGSQPEFLDQILRIRQALSGQPGTHTSLDLPDGGKACAYDSVPLDAFVVVLKADGEKCQRCWKYDVEAGPQLILCPRCRRVLSSGGTS
jgi:isoleucyl-tRNA synthetase